jgi:hypothetical protein
MSSICPDRIFDRALSKSNHSARSTSGKDWRRPLLGGHLERLSIALLQSEIPLPKPVRLLGVSLSSLQGNDQVEPQLGLPI